MRLLCLASPSYTARATESWNGMCRRIHCRVNQASLSRHFGFLPLNDFASSPYYFAYYYHLFPCSLLGFHIRQSGCLCPFTHASMYVADYIKENTSKRSALKYTRNDQTALLKYKHRGRYDLARPSGSTKGFRCRATGSKLRCVTV